MPNPRVIEVSSPSAIERGTQYGSAAADLIADAIAYYREAFARQARLDWEQALEHTRPWRRLIERDFPEISEEMEGIARGAGVRTAEIVALNCRGEIMYDNWFADPGETARLTWTRAHIAGNALITHRLLVHGNHYQAFVPPQPAAEVRLISPDSLVRVPPARKGLARAAHAASPADVRASVHAAMADHLGHPDSLCAHPDDRLPEIDQWSTTLSSCVDLTTGEYFLAAGPPCENAYELVPFNLNR